jgi:hypothetical protein
MQTLHLEIQNDLKDALVAFLKLLPSSAVKIYEDDDTTFTKDDEVAFKKAMDEKKNDTIVNKSSI